MLLAMVDDIRVILVKLADRLHNMRTLQFMSDERRVRTAQETLDIYAPIANRLGMAKIKNELEELAFKYLEPTGYESLRARVEEKRQPTEGVIEDLLAEIRTKLQDAQVPVIRIDGRIKRLYSIWLKLKRQKIDLDQVYDFVALRIVTDSVKDCYAALGIIHQTWSPVPGRIKDLIAMPRPNGYQSLHTSVISEHGFPFEVQIRTEEMDRRAEEGIAAHWKYKEGRVGAGRDEQYFQWLRQLLEWQQEVRDPQEFLTNLKIDLYPEEVYTFTPRGQVKVLPRGLDAGRLCLRDSHRRRPSVRRRARQRPHGAAAHQAQERRHRRDRHQRRSQAESRLAQFRRDVASAQQDQAPDSGRGEGARGRARAEAPREGRHAATTSISSKLLDSDGLSKAANDLGFQNDELFAQIGYGKLAPKQVLDKLVPQGELKEKAPEHPVVSAVKRVLKTGAATTDRIVVRGVDDLMVFRARCCNPIRGEKIVGYITRGKGVSVHSANCPNVLNLQYDPERRIEVEWDKGTDVAPYTVRLTMQVEDRKGMIAELSSRIANINTNIITLEASTRAEDQHARIDMTVEIQDVKHLEKVIKSIRGVEGVLGVERAATR